MKEIRQIQKRIRSRRNPGKSTVEPCRSVRRFHFFYTLIMLLLCGSSLALGWMIAEKKNLVSNEDLKRIEEKIKWDSLAAWLPFESWFGDMLPVSQNAYYQHLEDQFYTASGNQVKALADGLVVYTGQQQSGALIMVKQDNGIMVTYGNLQEIQVDLQDRILKGQTLGTFQQALYLDFSEAGQTLSYEEALAY